MLGEIFQSGCGGYYPWGTAFNQHYTPFWQFEDVLDEIVPIVGRPSTRSSDARLAVRELKGDGYRVITLVNTSRLPVARDGVLECDYAVNEATLYTNTEKARALAVKDNKIYLDAITDGGLIVVR